MANEEAGKKGSEKDAKGSCCTGKGACCKGKGACIGIGAAFVASVLAIASVCCAK